MSLKSLFCASCGKMQDALVGGLCHGCFLRKNPISTPRQTSIRYCTQCNSVWLGGVWIKAAEPIENYLLRMVVSRIKVPEEVALANVEMKQLGKMGMLAVTLRFGESEITVEKRAQLVIEKYCCPECSREKETTYLAIIQLRTEKDVPKFVKDASRIITRGAKLVKAEEQPSGIDLYLSDKNAAMSAAIEVRRKLNCKMKTSEKQFGWDRDRCRPLTKKTICLRER